MASSEVEICNSALSLCGVKRITALSDNTKPAIICNEHYHKERDALLRESKWNFAVSRVELAVTAETPVFGYTYVFQLPSDVLKIWETNPDNVEYSIEAGNKLLSDEATLDILYSAQITDVTKFTSEFSELLAIKLAVKICFELTQSRERTDDLERKFKLYRREVKSGNAQEDTPIVKNKSLWLNSRF